MEKYIFNEVNGELVASLNPEWQKHIQNLKYEYYLKDSNIPKDYWNLTYDHCGVGSNARAVAICKNYVNKIKKGSLKNLYLYGTNSTGKTTAMCNIGKDAIREGFKVQFVLSDDLIDLLQKTSGFSYIEELEKKKEKIYEMDIVLVDEVFDSTKSLLWKGESKNLIVSQLDSFFRHLVSNNKRIVVTSNILKERIASDYSLSLYELIDRNFQVLNFVESIKEERKKVILK